MSQNAKPRKIPPKRVLVVDDEPQVADTVRMVLAISGHKVEIAENAARALGLFEAGKYDLVISDFSLGNMNGLALARAIKERAPQQPIILITAYAETMAMKKDELKDIDFLLGKPFALGELQHALETIFPAA